MDFKSASRTSFIAGNNCYKMKINRKIKLDCNNFQFCAGKNDICQVISPVDIHFAPSFALILLQVGESIETDKTESKLITTTINVTFINLPCTRRDRYGVGCEVG